jgi:serine/threonine-protein kinase
MLVGALAVLALVAVAFLLVRPSGDTPADAGGSEETTAPTTVAAVELAATDFVGRPVQDVQAELVARGLQASLVPAETADVPAGEVLSVDPVGSLTPGAAVTVAYAVPPVAVPEERGDGGDQGGGNGNNGNGNGNGRGNDKDDDD